MPPEITAVYHRHDGRADKGRFIHTLIHSPEGQRGELYELHYYKNHQGH